jgi:hypothetical protein
VCDEIFFINKKLCLESSKINEIPFACFAELHNFALIYFSHEFFSLSAGFSRDWRMEKGLGRTRKSAKMKADMNGVGRKVRRKRKITRNF